MILELGTGFCFIGRQRRVPLGRNEYCINRLSYHCFSMALLAQSRYAARPAPSARRCWWISCRNLV
ncbi:hypothetical protein [Paucibacter sp. PLA-PC-4]|uniref:hypothetical protein n=1 Tax=Paucibacter sp. PLA-PC-4 TaxID=2993655 RepID=UPI003A4C56C2